LSYSLLIVDDEASVRSALRRSLRGENYEVLEAGSGREAVDILKKRSVDVIVSDHAMPEMTGIELLKTARVLRPEALRIILTGQADLEMAVQAINEDAVYRILQKPWENFDLKVVLRLACRHIDALREVEKLRQAVSAQAVDIKRLEGELETARRGRKSAPPGAPAVTSSEGRITRDPHGAVVISEDEIAEIDNIDPDLIRSRS
jgi:DNA-binding NtrC family response regulator